MYLLPAFTSTQRVDNEALIGRVHCADIEELCRAVGEGSVDAIITDLPYG